MHRQINIYHAEDAPDRKHYRHRHERLASAAADGRYRMRKCEQTVEQRFDARLLRSESDDIRRRIKRRDKRRGEDEVYRADDLRHHHSRKYPEPRALLCAVVFACAEVLPDERRYREAAAVYRHKGETLYLRVGAERRHRHLAEGVYLRLYYHVGEPDD